MGVPVATDCTWLAGSDGTPANDTDPIGNTPAGALTQANQNLLFDDTPAPAAGDPDVVHHNVAYEKNAEGAGGHMTQIRLWLTNGIGPNASAGPVTIYCEAGDAGKKIRLQGLVSGVTTPETVTLASPSVVASVNWDVGGLLRGELLASNGIDAVTADADILLQIAGASVACMRAGESQVTGEYDLAVCDTANAVLMAANRLASPTPDVGSLSSYTRPIRAGTVDTSIALPDLDDGETAAEVWRKTLYNGMLAPLAGEVVPKTAVQFAGSA